MIKPKPKLTSKQKSLQKKITNKKYSKFGFFSELDETQLEVYATGHPICTPPIMGTTCVFPFVSGGAIGCPDGSTTTTYCAS